MCRILGALIDPPTCVSAAVKLDIGYNEGCLLLSDESYARNEQAKTEHCDFYDVQLEEFTKNDADTAAMAADLNRWVLQNVQIFAISGSQRYDDGNI